MEKVFRLRKDIDTLYNAGFKDFVKAVDESLKREYMSDSLKRIMKKLTPDINKHGYAVIATFFSHELQTKDALKAHETHPVKITLELGYRVPAYVPAKHEIHLSISLSVLDLFNDHLWQKDTILDGLRGEVTIFNEISEFKLKGTINHELSHWIRNAQTGHIDKMFRKVDDKTMAAKEAGDIRREVDIEKKVLKQGKINTVATDYEMDAYIHNIMEYKRSIGLKKYNYKKLADLFIEIPSFRTIKIRFKKYKTQNISNNSYSTLNIKLDWQKKWIDWQKKLIKRLDREKLLGKNMRKIDKDLR